MRKGDQRHSTDYFSLMIVGLSVQAWISKLVEGELARKAPNLWPEETSASHKIQRRR